MVKRLGVTLMEMMIVVGIVSTMFMVAAPIMNQANKMFIMTRTKLELQQEARGVMYIITRNLRQAQSDTIVISRANANQPFYSKIAFTTEQSSTTAVSNSLVFQQEGTVLYQLIKGNKRVLSRNLNYLAFTFPRSDELGIVSVSVTLRKNIYEGRSKALHMASEKVRVMN
ncbi:MAG: hypothetical protein PHV36_09115 [Elusimicrobiales bacterium]|nr:hypothetical protein [Elusimicrobiales bacterium]